MSAQAKPVALARPLVALAVIGLVAGLTALDLVTAAPPDPFDAPPPVALGSGQAPGGAHCTAQ